MWQLVLNQDNYRIWLSLIIEKTKLSARYVHGNITKILGGSNWTKLSHTWSNMVTGWSKIWTTKIKLQIICCIYVGSMKLDHLPNSKSSLILIQIQTVQDHWPTWNLLHIVLWDSSLPINSTFRSIDNFDRHSGVSIILAFRSIDNFDFFKFEI